MFGALTGLSVEDICRDLPDARTGGVSVFRWESWLKGIGLVVLRRDGCPTDILPCAHLVTLDTPRSFDDCHWVYRDEDGDVHDPSPVFEALDADTKWMRNLGSYEGKLLTISICRAI